MQPLIIQTELSDEHLSLLQRIEGKLDRLLHGNPEEQFLTSAQTARQLKVSESTLCNWRKQGRISFHQEGRFIRYRASEVLAKMQELHIKSNHFPFKITL